MSCNCNDEKGENESIPYIMRYIYEGAQARNERTIKRLVISLVISIILMFLTNIAWLTAWCQYDYYSEDVQLEASGGNANYIGNDGDIINGSNTGAETQTNKETQL